MSDCLAKELLVNKYVNENANLNDFNGIKRSRLEYVLVTSEQKDCTRDLDEGNYEC